MRCALTQSLVHRIDMLILLWLQPVIYQATSMCATTTKQSKY